MTRSKFFHLIGIFGLTFAFLGHSLGALLTQLNPTKNLGNIYIEMKLLQLQKSPWITDYYDVLILLNWSLSVFLLFWIGINLLFFKKNNPPKKYFLAFNAFISILNLAFEIRYSFMLPISFFVFSTLGFIGAWWFYEEGKINQFNI